jgi:hypothetical protein
MEISEPQEAEQASSLASAARQPCHYEISRGLGTKALPAFLPSVTRQGDGLALEGSF